MSRQLLIALALCVGWLGFGVEGAEARARIRLGRSPMPTRSSAMPVNAHAVAVPSVALPLRTASVAEPLARREPPEEPVRTGGIPEAPTSPVPVPTPKADARWCASGTVVGSGRGFCVIN